jgi:cytochrome c oxidase subunit 2
LVAALLLGGVFLFSGCGLFNSPQNTFSPAGEVARDQRNIFVLTMWPALAIMIGVEAGLVYILFRFRGKKGDSGLPAQTHGNNKLEIAWTIAPIILLAFFIAPTVGGIVDLGRTPKDSVEVDVTGVQWAWQFAYPDPAGGAVIQAPIGEMHIPVGKTIALKLKAGDVIHSFWVPRLAGKTDAIPGRANHMWLKATETGTFEGQCAEFCGLGHGVMRFKVVVEEQADYDAWLKEQAAAQKRAGQPELAFEGD